MRNLILGLFLVGFVYCAPTNTTFSCDSTNTHCPTKTCILTKSGTCFESSCAAAGQCKSFKNCSPKDETCCCKTMNCWKNQKVDICEDEPEEEEEPTSTPALKTVKAKALAKPIAPLAKNTIAPKPVSTSKPASVKVAPKKAAPKSIATTEAPTTTTEEEGEQEPTTETATESSEVEETTVTEDENTSTEEHDDEILKKEADLEDEEETTTEEPQESTTDTEEEDEDEEETTTPVEDEENSTTDEPETTTESEDDETTTDTDEETSEEEVESTTPENESNEVHPVASTKDSEEDETASDDSDDDTFMQSRSRKLPAPIHASAKSHSSVESTTMHVITSSISNSKTSKEKSSAPIPWWSACLLGLIVASAVFCSVAIYLKRRKEKAAMANRRRSEPKKTDKLVDQLLLEKQAESQA